MHGTEHIPDSRDITGHKRQYKAQCQRHGRKSQFADIFVHVVSFFKKAQSPDGDRALRYVGI
jgi:hypothetical protein